MRGNRKYFSLCPSDCRPCDRSSYGLALHHSFLFSLREERNLVIDILQNNEDSGLTCQLLSSVVLKRRIAVELRGQSSFSLPQHELWGCTPWSSRSPEAGWPWRPRRSSRSPASAGGRRCRTCWSGQSTLGLIGRKLWDCPQCQSCNGSRIK